jgi:serine/threonine protein kinase/tetratricopeptide (TPR) repeat protein
VSPSPKKPACESLEELGQGATGRVWRVRLTREVGELAVGAPAALKRLRAEAAEDSAQRAAFALESRLALAIRHPGVVRGLAAGQDEESPWLLLQYLPGPDLRSRLEQQGALPEPQVRAVATRLCGALGALHEAGYLHGDLKPENVRLDADGLAVLIDLGFALPLERGASGQRVTGSMAYLSPEELRGAAASARSEVYALGVLLYELATGRHPFASAARLARGKGLVHDLTTAAFEPPSLSVPTLSPFLDRVLEWMLRREPEARPDLSQLTSLWRRQEESDWWRDQLEAPTLPPPRRTAVHALQALPLVGRDVELESLLAAARDALAQAEPESAQPERAGHGCLIELVGSSGSGKSRLMREFAARVRLSDRPPLFLHGRCSRFENQRPCYPIVTLLNRFLHLPAGSAPGARERARLEELLPSSERETLLEVLDPAFERVMPSAVPAALCTWLVRLGRRGPVIVFLDDLTFADEGTLEVLSRLMREFGELPLLVVVGRDSEETPRRPEAYRRLEERMAQLECHRSISLAPLTPEALEELTGALFTRSSPQLRLARVLWERSRGNPGLITELVRGLVDRGEALPTEAGLDLRIHPDDLPLPASLRGEILRAYGRLNGRDRRWLERLAVSGGRIQTRFLLRAWPDESPQELDQTLARLTRSGWLRPQGERYRFRRPALRAAIYKRLTPQVRRDQHAAVARALRPGPGGRQSLADAFQLAFHLRAAERYAELLVLLRPLVQRLRDRGQPSRVHSLGLWGLEAISKFPPEEHSQALALEFLWAATDAADRLGYRDRQRSLLDQLSELDIDPEAAPESTGRIYLMHARFSISIGQYGPARGMLLNALAAFRTAKNAALISDVLRRQSAVSTHTGDLAEGRRLAREAQELAPDDFMDARAEHALGVIDLFEGRIESALKRSDRCLMLLRRVDLFEVLSVRAMAHSLRARVYRGAGRPRRGLVSALHALRFARRAGDRRLEIELQARLGCHLLDVDRVEEAENHLRDTLLVSTEIEDRRSEAIAALFLGILLAEQDDPAGRMQLARCARVAAEMGLSRVEAVCIAIQARIAYQTDPQAALGLSERAVALLVRAGAELIDRIVIRGTHAMILGALGREAEAALQIERLQRRMAAATGRIESPLLQRRQRLATGQLLKAALSPEGPVYRRVRLEGV